MSLPVLTCRRHVPEHVSCTPSLGKAGMGLCPLRVQHLGATPTLLGVLNEVRVAAREHIQMAYCLRRCLMVTLCQKQKHDYLDMSPQHDNDTLTLSLSHLFYVHDVIP